ncbi:MAG: hypothetical protein KYX69_12180 [Sphingomonas sp.]|uniref:hypothetical protein n=1 Tax=Sphingomonas sp. TaxID=28214 RepID=UPI00262A350F|nr:hypothetical protein [Sphingomonas sp.]MDK2768462.1 hypothetical protein [Sphingomonas sp.]
MDPRHFGSIESLGRSVLLLGDEGPGTDAAIEAIAQAGLSCRLHETIDTAHLALEDCLADVLVLEVGSTPHADLGRLLDRLAAFSSETGVPLVASTPLEQLDLVAGHLWPIEALLLCEPTAADRRAALDQAVFRPRELILRDSAGARDNDLEVMREDIDKIARTVQVLAAETGLAKSSAFVSTLDATGRAEIVRRTIRARRMRERYFDSRLFADPAWDMLLDLYAAHLEGREVSISSLCIAAATPPTTALRWIGSMTDAGMLVRQPDQRDRRRHMISLSDGALRAIERYFSAAYALGTF